MIGWSIQAAIESECFEHIIVSTDDPQIAETARDFGAEVPFTRPSQLSDDVSGIAPVIQHAIGWLHEHKIFPELICQLLATAPFIQADDLRNGIKACANREYVLSVCEFPFPIQRAVRILDDGGLCMFHPEHFDSRSQDLPTAYHDAGQFCIGKTSAWIQGASPFGAGAAPMVLPRHRVQDIDTLDDWYQAELMYQALSLRSPTSPTHSEQSQ